MENEKKKGLSLLNVILIVIIVLLSSTFVMFIINSNNKIKVLETTTTSLESELTKSKGEVEKMKTDVVTAVEETSEIENEEINTTSDENVDNKFSKLHVTVTDMVVTSGDIQDFAEMKIDYQNNFDKAISGLKGEFVISDLFGEEIISFNWDMTEKNINAGETYSQEGYGLKLNKLMDDKQAKLSNTPYDKLTFKFIATQIVFEDGEVLK